MTEQETGNEVIIDIIYFVKLYYIVNYILSSKSYPMITHYLYFYKTPAPVSRVPVYGGRGTGKIRIFCCSPDLGNISSA